MGDYITLKLKTNNPTKDEEIAFLHKVREAVKGKNMYLSFLFTKNFVEWAESHIREDILPDIYSSYSYYLDNEEPLQEAQREVEELKREVSELEKELTDSQKELDRLYEENASLAQELRKKEEEITRLKAKLYDLMAEEG